MNTLKALLPLGLAAALVACKSKEETAAPATAKVERAAAKKTPGHTVFAASAHVRIVDTAKQAVVGRVQLQKAVREIRFSPDGATAYVAASDGVRAIDTATFEVRAKLTEKPTRYIELSSDGALLYALEHWVEVKPDGSRIPQPFSLVTVDTRTGEVGAREVVGERVLYAREAPSPEGRRVRILESGEIRVGGATTPWAEGEKLDPLQGLSPDTPFRVRKTLAHHGAHVFIPIEGDPARVLDLDTETGATRFFSLGEAAALRGLGVTPDGKTLLVNTGVTVRFFDLATGQLADGALTLPDAHVGCAVSDDGRFAYLARVVDKKGGAVTAIDLGTRKIAQSIHLDDITPWAIAVAPRARVAAR